MIVGVNADGVSPDRLRKMNAESGIEFLSFSNESERMDGPITRAWNVKTLPTTYVIGPDGKILARWRGKLARLEDLRSVVIPAVEEAERAK